MYNNYERCNLVVCSWIVFTHNSSYCCTAS